MDREAALELLRSQHDFPSDHRFHVIVLGKTEDIDAILARVINMAALSSLEGRVEVVPSRHGRYVSLRLTLPCASAEHVLDFYALFQQCPEIIRYF
jgi:putative lipoic acid-binding regulatory protein